MERYTSTSLLLISTLCLWEWHSAQPLLDNTLPHLPISSHYTDLYIPLSEVIAGCVSLLTTLSAFSLYWVVVDYKLTFGRVLVFVVCVYMMASGSGMHVGCVTAENNICDGNMDVESLSALLHFMHEYWSHNTVLFGFFGMMLLATWMEILYKSGNSKVKLSIGKRAGNQTQTQNEIQKKSDSSNHRPTAATDSTVHNRGRIAPNGNTSHCVNGSTGQQSLNKGQTEDSSVNSVYKVLVQWILPLQTGLYFSVFSSQTSTEFITAIFYVSVLVMFVIAYMKFQSRVCSLLSYVTLCHSDLILLGTFIKAAFVGLVTLIGLYI